MNRTGRVLASLFLGLAGTVLLTLLGAGPASSAAAHATLVSVSPADGTTLTSPVAKVTFSFDENIRMPSKVVVTGPHGERASHGTTTVLDNTVSVAVRLQPRPEDVGRYVAAYRVVSADGHVVSAESTFQYRPPGIVAAAPTPAAATHSDSSQVWWILGGVVVVVLFALFLVLPLLRRGGRRG